MVMDSLVLDTDMKVTLEVIDGCGENENVLSLQSAIEEVIGDKYLLIHEPMHMGLTYQLPMHESVLMSIHTDSNRHILHVQHSESVVQGDLKLLKVKRLGYVEHDQRRACFRLSIYTPVKIGRPLPNFDGQKFDLMHITDAHTIDLSDSGLLFSTNEHFEEGHELHIHLDIGTDAPLIGSVIRTKESNHTKYKHDVAVKLKHADKHQRDHLYKYLVKKQLEMRRQGKLHTARNQEPSS